MCFLFFSSLSLNRRRLCGCCSRWLMREYSNECLLSGSKAKVLQASQLQNIDRGREEYSKWARGPYNFLFLTAFAIGRSSTFLGHQGSFSELCFCLTLKYSLSHLSLLRTHIWICRVDCHFSSGESKTSEGIGQCVVITGGESWCEAEMGSSTSEQVEKGHHSHS